MIIIIPLNNNKNEVDNRLQDCLLELTKNNKTIIKNIDIIERIYNLIYNEVE